MVKIRNKAGVVKLADTIDSKSIVREDVSVRLRPPALPLLIPDNHGAFLTVEANDPMLYTA